MAEEVQTGGVMSFRYEKGQQPKLSEEQKRAIERGYAEAAERKRKERQRRMIFYMVVAALVIVAVVGYVVLR